MRLVTSAAGGVATIQVSMGFHETLTGDIRLAVFITEDNITGYDQANYVPAYGPDPITDYVFMHVVRGYVTPVFGDKIDLSVLDEGGGISRTFTYAIPEGLIQANLNVIAIVHTFGPDPEDKKVLNAQEVKLGETKDWD
jgi:hypothetical protein